MRQLTDYEPVQSICHMPEGSTLMQQTSTTALLPLELSSVSFRIGDKLLLDNISTTIVDPGITVIMGSNGAGKSLFVRLVHGLLEPSSGEIHWNGKPLDLVLRRRQALVFQKPVLLRRSVAANIDFVLKPRAAHRKRKRDQILREVDLFKQRSQPARLLSGGEQQRLALARALATDPEVLLLDEPSASLDPATTIHIENQLMQTRERGVKIILVTHDIGQARRLADDVMFMHNGQLLEHRSAEAFFKSPSSEPAKAYLEGRLIL